MSLKNRRQEAFGKTGTKYTLLMINMRERGPSSDELLNGNLENLGSVLASLLDQTA